ncbi:hypothetical protein GCM10010112_70140 [Actinoplanes lobatus]|uniref:Putative membrane protein YphA (DoxX/SURF4 family) n=1 Tax=Actinoplanes lobatus TaxID=113568 RepID=A0A7W7HLZ2_9ACTN|nr:DoxX family protein [Actinoplanes lobatus]MBB4753009.1 putative membrane protein YphA (DoxX/SURF4 family) [Actinoplanes lobatus]GGN87472.1 hypothetical protein GCM10010112_70140 [Actinoplanes lobatus]GIE39616.1 hypothetical protein Alo02nite_25140 [Actinoplanes lobatus]
MTDGHLLLLPVLAGLFLIWQASVQLRMPADYVKELDVPGRYGYPAWLWRPFAAVQLGAAVCLLIGTVRRPVGLAAASVLVVLFLAETVARLTTRTWRSALIPGVFLLLPLTAFASLSATA